MKRFLVVLCLICLVVGVTIGVIIAQEERTCPALMSLDECHVYVEKVKFTPEITDGITMKEDEPDKFKHAIVTLRIEKPEGKVINLAAADVTLHYRRTGEDFDVAPCEAMSNFTASLDGEDRTLDSGNISGPGWHKVKTGTATRNAKVVYLDVVFSKLEKDVSAMWICVAQRGGPSFATEGW